MQENRIESRWLLSLRKCEKRQIFVFEKHLLIWARNIFFFAAIIIKINQMLWAQSTVCEAYSIVKCVVTTKATTTTEELNKKKYKEGKRRRRRKQNQHNNTNKIDSRKLMIHHELVKRSASIRLNCVFVWLFFIHIFFVQ